jgi:pimeloyl-ACP methyl ester carboxylesterase
VFLFGWPTHLGLLWEEPSFAGFLGKLASFSRLVLFDRLGDGLSDRGPTGHTFDDEMDDVRSVLAAVGSGRAAYFGCHTGGRLALLLAATHPDEVSAVVTFGSHPATLRDDEYPWGATPEARDEIFAFLEAWHPSEVADRLLADLAPGEAGNPAVRQWWRMFSASASSPVETRGLLGTIQARCWSCTGRATGWPACRPAATWPSGSPGPGWSSCPATTTCPSSATRMRWSPWPRSS